MSGDDKNDDDMKKLFVDIVLNSTEIAERLLDLTKQMIEDEKLPSHVVPSSLIFAGVLSMIEAAIEHGEHHRNTEFMNSMYWMVDLALESYTSMEEDYVGSVDKNSQKTLH